MATSLEVAGDVAAAGGALAGLILVYLGSVSASYVTLPKEARKFALERHRRRAWFAFAGLMFCLVALGLAVVGKRANLPYLADASIVLLALGLISVAVAGMLTVLEIT